MPKRHRPGHTRRRQSENNLAKVNQLIKRKQWIEARERVQELDRRYPNNNAVLPISDKSNNVFCFLAMDGVAW